MGVAQLREKYAEVFREATSMGNRTRLVRRFAWIRQANAEGGIGERARKRAEELARDADLRLTAHKDRPATAPAPERSRRPKRTSGCPLRGQR